MKECAGCRIVDKSIEKRTLVPGTHFQKIEIDFVFEG